ncbi:hypothetical protein [Curtobacterium sp. VKM Ac-2884]|uniref:hypothetical protein n=1 Tax=Curtobacterium sp. VKM Ac-2884 TaxID=2783818 RepID=UPI001889DCF4|nr:hypothetical protein [Curtobacterium sp. VKM Ac-2884]MBF4602820.1 hypothetical protein [Curtobacterium sp. VKM Ac-2884]
MSAETKAALDQAVAAHFADEQDGAILTGYVLQAKGQGFTDGDNDRTRLLRAIAEGQDYITTLGLVDWMRIVAQRTALED